MPTPVTHLSLAYEVALTLGVAERAAFLFGAVAPDAAHFLGKPREETHFWSLGNDVSGALRVLSAYPQLQARFLSSSERDVIAGYLCHLVTDEQWTFCIWRPYFGRNTPFKGGPEGASLQSAYRDVLDADAFTASPGATALARSFERPLTLRDGLLPFLDGHSLERYRLALLEQIRRGAPTSDTALHIHASGYVLPESREQFRCRAIEESVKLVADYLAGRSLRPPLGTETPVPIAT